MAAYFRSDRICEVRGGGELYYLNERNNLLHICQHVELVNYPFNMQTIVYLSDLSVWTSCQTKRALTHPGLGLVIFIAVIVSPDLQLSAGKSPVFLIINIKP